MRSVLTLIVSACCLATGGCVPEHERFLRAEVPGAQYLRSLCAGSGPPNWTYYAFEGIHISIGLSWLQIGLHYPPGTRASFDTDIVTVRGERNGEPFTASGHLLPGVHGTAGNSTPASLNAAYDPLDPERRHGYGPHSGSNDFIWASYWGFEDASRTRVWGMPSYIERGVLIIPAITVNGQSYPPQEIPLVWHTWTGILPVNC